ncbi:MAG: NDP-hexose 2,3-dehydratase family protein, partial [Clostridia bacterium]
MDSLKFIISLQTKEYINSNCSILERIKKKNSNIKVNIIKTTLDDISNFWKFNMDGNISNKNSTFFSIEGIKVYMNTNLLYEQPIIVQPEIGYLGIICKQINNILYFLMQAKIEPGNINKIQISPTIQATKSNFTQKHGGKVPNYLDYFLNSNKYDIIVDQIQSEQSSRFYKKRNRNIIIDIGKDEIEVLPSHMWMTLGQIKNLMKYENLVNMDTRTVISCIPYCLDYTNIENYRKYINNQYLFNSIFNNDESELPKAFALLNNYKMFSTTHAELCSLRSLNTWLIKKDEIISKTSSNFKVIFCNLEIEGREVTNWSQPLIEANGIALFVLFYAKFGNKYKYLVKIAEEYGTFDCAEFGPTIQEEFADIGKNDGDTIKRIYLEHMEKNIGIANNVLLSEEGGRFYHEQNRNIIIEIDKEEIEKIPKEYIWLDFKTLNLMVQTNNILNIQLRNLLSL